MKQRKGRKGNAGTVAPAHRDERLNYLIVSQGFEDVDADVDVDVDEDVQSAWGATW